MSNITYNPTLSGLIGRTEQDWGKPEENRQNLVYYGINYVDQFLLGIDVDHGEVVGIQAEAKQRKSTMLANIVLNVAATKRFWTVVDTLESGMPPSAYRDVLISIAATRIMISHVFGTDRKEWPGYNSLVQHPSLATELKISKEFLRYRARSKSQLDAINKAKGFLSEYPIAIFGPAKEQGNARNLTVSLNRWDKMYNGTHPEAPECKARLFCCDHVQQVAGFEGNDYQRMETVVDALSNFVTTHPGSAVIVVSQLGLGSVRLERQGIGRAMAKGGARLEAEANVLFRTRYDKDVPHKMEISVDATRRSPPPAVIQELEPSSGAFLRPAYLNGRK